MRARAFDDAMDADKDKLREAAHAGDNTPADVKGAWQRRGDDEEEALTSSRGTGAGGSCDEREILNVRFDRVSSCGAALPLPLPLLAPPLPPPLANAAGRGARPTRRTARTRTTTLRGTAPSRRSSPSSAPPRAASPSTQQRGGGGESSSGTGVACEARESFNAEILL